MPFKGAARMTSPFGWRKLNGESNFHNGVDLVGVYSTDIVSPLDGTVIMVIKCKFTPEAGAQCFFAI